MVDNLQIIPQSIPPPQNVVEVVLVTVQVVQDLVNLFNEAEKFVDQSAWVQDVAIPLNNVTTHVVTDDSEGEAQALL